MSTTTVERPTRTRSVPQEIWDIVGVVLGEHPRTLTGWQLDDALRAMSALGHGTLHMAACLKMHRATIEKKLKRLGLRAHLRDQRLDEIGIAIAVLGGRIALRGPDAIEAIRQLAERRLNKIQIARRLMIPNPDTVATMANRHGIRLIAADAQLAEVCEFARWQRERAAVRDRVLRHLFEEAQAA